jgi:phosphoesterase RecJ-like protein
MDIMATIREEIKTAQRILVTSHIRPDGDAIGSLLGFGLALEVAGKLVQMVLVDGVPDSFTHLDGCQRIHEQSSGDFDLIIVLDVSDRSRLGKTLNDDCQIDINIDHHFTNNCYARLNLIESEAVATSEIIARHLPELGLKITPPVANALLTGIITDTIGFRTGNVTADVLRVVADLMDAGGSLSETYYPALVQRTFAGVRYWGAGLSRLQFIDGLVWSYLSLDDCRLSGYLEKDDADLINVLSAIDGADVAMIVVEQSPSRVKISWRLCGNARQSVDVSQIAKLFDGGGHKAAAGAEMDGTLTEVVGKVVGVTQEYLARGNGQSA